MQLGFIGAGNMARALARGIGEPVLCADPVPGRAEALALDTGGRALAGNAEVADQADVVVLCHKPGQLQEVAAEIAPARILSILGATPVSALREAYPHARVTRVLPNTPVEVKRGVLVVSAQSDRDPELEELLARAGTVVALDDALVDAAMALMSCAPAYVALLAEAQTDAGVRKGLPAPLAAQLVTETFAGTAELLRVRGHDTLAVRREVTSPGGSTARGLAALERAGVRAAFHDAIDAVLEAR